MNQPTPIYKTLALELFPPLATQGPGERPPASSFLAQLSFDLFQPPRRPVHLDLTHLQALAPNPMAYGRYLGEQLFAPQALGDDYRQAAGAIYGAGFLPRVRLRLPEPAEAPALHQIVWERLHHPTPDGWQPLASALPFSRHLSVARVEPYRPFTERRLKLLAVIASPARLGDFALLPIPAADRQALHQVLQGLPDCDVTWLESDSAAPPTLERLRAELARGYHLVHILAHGRLGDDGQSYLFLEQVGGEGAAEAVTGAAVVALAQAVQQPPALMVLMACETARQGEGRANLAPLGYELVQAARVEAVVSMGSTVSMSTARRFTEHFYQRLTTHGVIDRAMIEARAAAQEQWDWSAPVLAMRSEDGRLFVEPDLLVSQAPAAPPTPGVAPYLGLATFSESDAPRFFGRATLSQSLSLRLQQERLLVLLGASGSGKSSLVRAGVIPLLRAEGWRMVTTTPTATPFEALVRSLHPDPTPPPAELAEVWRAEPWQLAAWLETPAAPPTLLVIDQLEELFTLCPDPDTRHRFARALLLAAQTGRATRVLLVLRDDYLTRTAEIPGLREALDGRQVYVGPLSGRDLIEVITGPARQGDWKLEQALLQKVLVDVGDQPGALPLLSQALLETWKRRQGRVMTLAAYEEEVGGVAGVIQQTADRVYADLSPAGQQLARNILLRLIALEERPVDMARRAPVSELLSDAAAPMVLERLAQERLITLEGGSAALIHEAVIRHWPALQLWLSQNRPGLIIWRRLTDDAAVWESQQRHTSYLYWGEQLRRAQACLPDLPLTPSPLEHAFLQASLRRERVRRTAQMGLALAAVTAVALFFLLPWLWRQEARRLNPAVPSPPFPAGLARLGDDTPGARAHPPRAMSLGAFAVHQYEVSNRLYALCDRANRCDSLTLTGAPDEPVVNVTAVQATQLCAWLGGRLPTEAEWERAARGTTGRRWPWGDTPAPNARWVNMSITTARSALAAVADPTFAPGATPEGIMHLLGNVAEWTLTPAICEAEPYCAEMWDGVTDTLLAVRGGSVSDSIGQVYPMTQTTFVSALRMGSSQAEIGFRCVFPTP